MFNETLLLYANRAVPIVLVDGAIDEVATVQQLLTFAIKGGVNEASVYDMIYTWDFNRGISIEPKSPQLTEADTALQSALDGDKADSITGMFGAINTATKLVEILDSQDRRTGYKMCFVFYMGDRMLSAQSNQDYLYAVQCLLNCRDRLKTMSSCFYFIGINFEVPPELKEHIKIVPASLPTPEDYGFLLDTVQKKYEAKFDKEKPAGIKKQKLTAEKKKKCVETLVGMSAFNAEQTTYCATSLDTGIKPEALRESAIQTINSTRGLTVLKGDGRGFGAIGGLDAFKNYAKRLLAGNLNLKALIFVDEIEKMLGGTASDSSGVSQAFFGKWLSEMQDTNALGLMFVGVPGCAKSEMAKRFGEEANVLTIRKDMGAMKDSLVGNSEMYHRRAMDVIREIGGTDGGILYIATCNQIKDLPPEFRRRFNLGTFFFSFPTDEERSVIWEIYLNKYNLGAIPDEDKLPLDFDNNWTGAEIESCCRIAHLMQCPIDEAAKQIVPVSVIAREKIDILLNEANNKYLSASQDGTFVKPKAAAAKRTIDRGLKF